MSNYTYDKVALKMSLDIFFYFILGEEKKRINFEGISFFVGVNFTPMFNCFLLNYFLFTSPFVPIRESNFPFYFSQVESVFPTPYLHTFQLCALNFRILFCYLLFYLCYSKLVFDILNHQKTRRKLEHLVYIWAVKVCTNIDR